MRSRAPGEGAKGEDENHRWLLRFLRGPVESMTGGELGASPSDWRALLECAGRHGLSPLVYGRLLAGASAPRIPEAVLESLRIAFLTNAAKNALAYRDLQGVLGAFDRRRIPAIILKGAFLAGLVYGHIGHRTMGDIDLLVRRGDMASAAEALQSIGYRFEMGMVPDIDAWCRVRRHLPRLHKPPGPGIELHWTILPPLSACAVDVESLWNRSRPATLAGSSSRCLAPEDLLLHLCVHGAFGDGAAFCIGLRPFCDIAAVVRRFGAEIDWERLANRALDWGVGRWVHLALALAHELLDAVVPDACMRALSPADPDARCLALAREQALSAGRLTLSAEARMALAPLKGLERSVAAPFSGGGSALVRTLFQPQSDPESGLSLLRSGSPNRRGRIRHLVHMLARGAEIASHSIMHPGQALILIRQFHRDALLRRRLDEALARSGCNGAGQRTQSSS